MIKLVRSTIWIVTTSIYLSYVVPFLGNIPVATVLANTENDTIFQQQQDEQCLNNLEATVKNGSYEPTSDVFISEIITTQSIKQLNSLAPQTLVDQIATREYIEGVVGMLGPVGLATIHDSASSETYLAVCSNYPRRFEQEVFNPLSSISINVLRFVYAVIETTKITFKNPIDRYYLLGEPCPAGFDWSRMDDGENPCIDFDIRNDFIPNGEWDAPKVDRRVLSTLIYLTTPVESGGAGREHIRVARLVQTDDENILDGPEQTTSVLTPENDSAEIEPANDDVFATTASESAITSTIQGSESKYRIDPSEPAYAPTTVSAAVMIDEIDKMRVTTKVEERSVFGSASRNNKVTYTYSAPSPIKVGWQSDDSIPQNPYPNFDQASQLENTRFVLNASIVSIMNQFGVGDLELDVSAAEVNDFGDVAGLVGQSLFEQIIGTPNGSMKGYDLDSVLKNIGLAGLEQRLSLVPGSLADTNTLDSDDTSTDFTNLARLIGTRTVEYVLGYPTGTLRTENGTSREILESIGRTHLETNLFKIQAGSLTPSDRAPIRTVEDMLTRIGEGAIERAFQLPAQSLRVESYDDVRKTSRKASLLFPEIKGGVPTRDQIDTANWISTQLQLEFMPVKEGANVNSYGFTERDFELPSLDVATRDWKKFLQLVGGRTIENTVGVFNRQGISVGDGKANTRRLLQIDSIRDVASANGTFNDYDLTLVPRVLNVPRPESSRVGNIDVCLKEDTNNDPNQIFTSFFKEDKAAALQEILRAGGDSEALNDNFPDSFGPKAFNCREIALKDDIADNLDLTTIIRQTLFNEEPIFTKKLLNQDGAPSLEQFAIDKWTWPAFLTANIIYFNQPENNTTVGLNTIRPYTPLVSRVFDVETADPFGLPVGIRSVNPDTTAKKQLDALINSFPSASRLRERISLLQARLDRIDQVFSEKRLADLPDREMLLEMAVRANLIIEKPAEDAEKFADQYRDPAYNGLLFIAQDISSMLECIADRNGREWVLGTEQAGMICAPSERQPTAEQRYYLQELKKKVDSLITGNVVPAYEALIMAITQGTLNDPTGTNQSAMSQVAALDSLSPVTDENRRLSVTENRYSNDLLRALLNPEITANGSVNKNASVEQFFYIDSNDRSFIGEIGRIRAAQTFNTDKLDQRTFINFLKTDLAREKGALEREDQAIDRFVNAVTFADDNLQKVNTPSINMLDKGINSSDFQRIFQLNLGNQVFDRVGKEELLRVLWQQGDLKDRTAGTFQSVLKQLNTFTQRLEFYTVRFEKLDRLADQMTTDINTLDSYNQNLLRSIKAMTDETKPVRANVKSIVKAGQRIEPLIGGAEASMKKIKESSPALANRVLKQLGEFAHTLQEIAVGRPLPNTFDFTIDAFNNIPARNRQQRDVCFNPGNTLSTFLQNGGRVRDTLALMSFDYASCTLEDSLGLPDKTIYYWTLLNTSSYPVVPWPSMEIITQSASFSRLDYLNTDETGSGEYTEEFKAWVAASEQYRSYFKTDPATGKLVADGPTWNNASFGLSSLQVATGIAAAAEQRERTSLTAARDAFNRLWVSRNSDLSYVKNVSEKGRDILEKTAIARLTSLIPGIGQFTSQYKITQREFVSILLGDMRPLVGKVGGAHLDQAFGFKPGTMNEVIYPICYDTTGNVAACSNRSDAPATLNSDNMAMRNLTMAVLDKMGLEAPNFPRNFSFRNAGTIVEAWGNALVTERLGLEPNSFRGKIGTEPDPTKITEDSLVRSSNTNTRLAQAFGFGESPYYQRMKRIIDDAKRLYEVQFPAPARTRQREYQSWQFAKKTFDETLDGILENYRFTSTFGMLSTDDYKNSVGYFGASLTGDSQSDSLRLLQSKEMVAFQRELESLWKLTSSLTGERLAVVRYATILNIFDHLDEVLADSYRDNLNQENYTSFLSREDLAFLAEPLSSSVISGINPNAETRRTIASRYQPLVKNFSFRVSSLDREFSNLTLSKDKLEGNSFTAFALNLISGDQLNGEIGGGRNYFNSYMTGQFDRWLDEDQNSIFAKANKFFKIATQNPDICNESVSLGKFIADLVSKPNSEANCGFKGMSALNMNDLLISEDPTNTALRFFLVDAFIGQAAVNDLEQDLGVRRGMVTRILTRPRQANQILTQEGIIKIHDQVFGGIKYGDCGADKSRNNCATNAVIDAVSNAYFSGFCENNSRVKRNGFDRENPNLNENTKCSFDFNKRRSATAFSNTLYNYVDVATKSFVQREVGIELSSNDVQLLWRGDSRAINLVGLQLLVNQVQDRVKENRDDDPNLKYYLVTYQESRDSVGLHTNATVLGKTTAAIQSEARFRATCADLSLTECRIISNNFTDFDGAFRVRMRQQVADEIRTALQFGSANREQLAATYGTADFDRDGTLTDEEINTYSTTRRSIAGDPANFVATTSVAYNAQLIRQEEERKVQLATQRRIMFKTLDLAAYNADQNIPPGFSERIFSDDESQFVDAIGNYIFTGIMRSEGTLADFAQGVCGNTTDTLQIQNCYSFINTLGAAIKEQNPEERKSKYTNVLIQATYVRNLDATLRAKLEEAGLGLPAGSVTGLLAWQAAGGEWRDLNKEQITIAGVNYVPVGRIIQNDQTDRALTWVSRQTGMSARSVKSLYNIGAGAINIIKLQSVVNGIDRAIALNEKISALPLDEWYGPGMSNVVANDTAKLAERAKSSNAQLAVARQATAAEIAGFVIDEFELGKFFADLDAQLRLPPGTMETVGRAILTAGALMATGLTASAAIASVFGPAFFIAIGLNVVFGTTGITTTVRATGDGFYPFYEYGRGRAKKPDYSEHRTTDRLLGEVNALNKFDYRNGIKAMAREKVRGLLVDLASMPSSGYAENNGYTTNPADSNAENTRNLWVSQVFTYFNPAEGIAANPLKPSDTLLQNLLNANSPFVSGTDSFGNPLYPGWGYGPIEQRCTTVESSGSEYVCTRNESYLSGMFAVKNEAVLNGIHISF